MHNSLVLGKCGCNLELVIFILISSTEILSSFNEIALRWTTSLMISQSCFWQWLGAIRQKPLPEPSWTSIIAPYCFTSYWVARRLYCLIYQRFYSLMYITVHEQCNFVISSQAISPGQYTTEKYEPINCINPLVTVKVTRINGTVEVWEWMNKFLPQLLSMQLFVPVGVKTCKWKWVQKSSDRVGAVHAVSIDLTSINDRMAHTSHDAM